MCQKRTASDRFLRRRKKQKKFTQNKLHFVKTDFFITFEKLLTNRFKKQITSRNLALSPSPSITLPLARLRSPLKSTLMYAHAHNRPIRQKSPLLS